MSRLRRSATPQAAFLEQSVRAIDVIRTKRDGEELSPEAIDSFVRGATSGEGWTPYQLSSLLMAMIETGLSLKRSASRLR